MIDFQAGEPQFIDHLAPIWRALAPDERGDFVVRPRTQATAKTRALLARAERRGVEAVTRSSDRRRPVVVASWGDMMSAGRQHIARLEHGIGQSFAGSDHPSYAGGRGAGGVGLFLVPNEHAASRWRAAYPRARVDVVGCPKLPLPAREPGPGPVVALSFHWGTSTRTGGAILESHGSFREYANVLGRVAAAFSVIGHGHPKALHDLAREYRRVGITVVEDFEDVCRQADIYVCDTNSTIYEFASTGRPVVVVNGRHFRRDVNHGLRFWEASTVGVNCNHPRELVDRISEALADPPEQQAERERCLDIVYAHRTGAAELAAAALRDWILTGL